MKSTWMTKTCRIRNIHIAKCMVPQLQLGQVKLSELKPCTVWYADVPRRNVSSRCVITSCLPVSGGVLPLANFSIRMEVVKYKARRGLRLT